jgi:hypothetical protein
MIDGQSSPFDVQALISSSLFTYTQHCDMSLILDSLHNKSPFRTVQPYAQVPFFESSKLLDQDSVHFSALQRELLTDSYLHESSSLISGISRSDIQTLEEKDRDAILAILRDFHSRSGNEHQLHSLTPASSPPVSGCSSANSSFSIPQLFTTPIKSPVSLSDETSLSLAEEGRVQSLKFTLAFDALASKNLLQPVHAKPELCKLQQKTLVSLASACTSMLQDAFPCHPCSPLLRKLVFCRGAGAGDTLEIVAAVSTTGCGTALTLEYSNVDVQNRACVDYRRADRLLLTQAVARALADKSAAWLSCGFEHCALVTHNGLVLTWGYGASGCLGHGDRLSCGFPKVVQAIRPENARYVECGGYHTFVVTENNAAFVWGRADVNQLGLSHRLLCKDEHGYVALRPMRLEAFGNRVRGAACGEAHTLVLEDEGMVYAFGWGEDGQLGPIVESEKGVGCILFQFEGKPIKVAAGLIFSACLTDNGNVYVWGNGMKGQFGREIEKEFLSVPQKMDVEGIIDVVCGESCVICVSEKGVVYGWGLGKAGFFSSQTQNFATGCELVCYAPKILGETDIIHHIMV